MRQHYLIASSSFINSGRITSLRNRISTYWSMICNGPITWLVMHSLANFSPVLNSRTFWSLTNAVYSCRRSISQFSLLSVIESFVMEKNRVLPSFSSTLNLSQISRMLGSSSKRAKLTLLGLLGCD